MPKIIITTFTIFTDGLTGMETNKIESINYSPSKLRRIPSNQKRFDGKVLPISPSNHLTGSRSADCTKSRQKKYRSDGDLTDGYIAENRVITCLKTPIPSNRQKKAEKYTEKNNL